MTLQVSSALHVRLAAEQVDHVPKAAGGPVGFRIGWLAVKELKLSYYLYTALNTHISVT